MNSWKFLAVAILALALGTACSSTELSNSLNQKHVAEDVEEVMKVK